jgi:hypothetical protein
VGALHGFCSVSPEVLLYLNQATRASIHISVKLSFKISFPFCAISPMLSLKSRNKHDHHLGRDHDLKF